MRRIIVITGPTAVGKTALAVDVAKKFPVRLISVDSGQVYRGLDLGTAKPSRALLREFPHDLVDVRDVADVFSVVDFCSAATQAINESFDCGVVPVLVGGAMFYISALFQGLGEVPPADQHLRHELSQQGQLLGWPRMHEKLSVLDPASAERIDRNDPQRIQRALEVYVLTKGDVSVWDKRKRFLPPDISVSRFILAYNDRALLHQRIVHRFDEMLEAGLVEEVEGLMGMPGVTAELPAMKSVGYRQVLEYLRGEVDLVTMRERALSASRQLAKRQLTWSRNTAGGIWLDAADPQVNTSVSRYLKQVEHEPSICFNQRDFG
ncbi:MAG: tRNA (adenosine(37)-N6)-dimethylallyltransferase MiaA [Gammaproteobacteria bacterium]|jgi:tRNA dimethylallyltransferase|nr:tRNA (adenosine(37)-N6)-dimethylallyltransferase MiaA [Gammaproteobacteria bacterium]HIO18891.1 tRNA (adenosine(37)-N6)-dimethylallyltransferase MiaA [Gammaproteobacteria bacterium]HIP04643.1 tRNA (adenosine(37)-N6)-dimethylallyltransferase MiaA [Gammaproteobacteria bacterium]